MITQVTRHLLQIVSLLIMRISRIKDNNKKIKTLYHLIFYEIEKESILVEFPYCPQNELVAKRFLSKFHEFTSQKFQVTITWSLRKLKICFLWKIGTLTQHARFINEPVFVMKHILMKPLGMLTFDGMSMRTYVRNLNL